MGADTDEWHVTTDPDGVRQWADEHGAVPVRDPDGDAGPSVDVVTPQASSSAVGGAETRQIPWDQFAELFEAEHLAFRYRDVDPDDATPACHLIDRDAVAETASEAATGGTSSQGVAADRIVASDTGDAEPVVEDRVESDTDSHQRESGRERGRTEPRTEQSQQPSSDARASPTSDAARDAAEQPLVLDELYEDPGGFGSDPDDEYLVLRNDGEQRLDLGGWRVENGAGESFEFPPEFGLDPGESVTLHSGEGRDTDTDLHWRADEPVWDEAGGTVVVRSPGGQRVLREPYKDG